MTMTVDSPAVDLNTLNGAVGVKLNYRPFYLVDPDSYERMARAQRNIEYLNKLEESREQYRKGQVVVKTLEELEAMAAE